MKDKTIKILNDRYILSVSRVGSLYLKQDKKIKAQWYWYTFHMNRSNAYLLPNK